MYRLTKVHRNCPSGAYVWGSVHLIEENILLLNNIYLSNDTAVRWRWQKWKEGKGGGQKYPPPSFFSATAIAAANGPMGVGGGTTKSKCVQPLQRRQRKIVSVLLSASVDRLCVSRMRDFYNLVFWEARRSFRSLMNIVQGLVSYNMCIIVYFMTGSTISNRLGVTTPYSQGRKRVNWDGVCGAPPGFAWIY